MSSLFDDGLYVTEDYVYISLFILKPHGGIGSMFESKVCNFRQD